MIDIIDGALFQRMVIHASASISAQKQSINELNVFPVPDGDTGTNMSLTIGTAAAEAKKKPVQAIGQAASINASALLRGARGNSGVILSLLFRGMSKALKERETADGAVFAAALSEGVAAAYKAVMKPAEGTILTVSRLASAKAVETAHGSNSVEAVLEAAIAEGQTALADTVNQNPVLKKAGVVDAGGKGFLIILQGMLDELRGVAAPEAEDDALPAVQEKADFAALSQEEITFAFDTVYIVRKTKGEVDLDPYREYLNSIGDSLVIGEDDESFKVHVHTNTPGDALNEAQKYGTLELAKIENMVTQAQDLAAGRKAQSTDDLEQIEAELEAPQEQDGAIAAPEKKIGVVAVSAGEGLASVLKDLGVDGVISGGQTMNPSTEDILREIARTPAETVFVLPNNKNIILAAEQCVGLIEGKKVVVVPTRTVPQGIAAMLALDPEGGIDDNTAAMEEARKNVRTSEITYAARDSDFDGFDIHEGDYMALADGQLFGTDKSINSMLERLAQADSQQQAEFINIFYGEDVSEDQAGEALSIFQKQCPNAEITLLAGGQPVYYYMISAE